MRMNIRVAPPPLITRMAPVQAVGWHMWPHGRVTNGYAPVLTVTKPALKLRSVGRAVSADSKGRPVDEVMKGY
jgi:hypothetical protein